MSTFSVGRSVRKFFLPRIRLILTTRAANFCSPIADPELLATWLAFWSLASTDAKIGKIHDDIYANNRRDIEQHIALCGSPPDLRLAAIGLSALIDGLWLELSLGGAPFTAEEAEALAEQWVTTLLGREQQSR